MRRLLDWEREAIVDAYAGDEKIDAISAEFGICRTYPGILAKRQGLTTKPRGRPKSKQIAKPVVIS